MATTTSAAGGSSRLGRILGPALDKMIKNASWRKHGKLVQDCKAVVDKLAAVSDAANANASADEEAVLLTDSPLVDENILYSAGDAEFILQPFIAACETQVAKVAEPALDCFQKLIAQGHLRGEVDVDVGVGSSNSGVLVQIMNAICKCHDSGDEGIELLVLKTLLTAVISTTLAIHGDFLLKAIRTCYNVFLGSKVIVNQTTAKASLTQMLVIVFRRMEADSSTIPIQPIVVADLMESAERSASDANVTQSVQNIITKVVLDMEIVFPKLPSVKPLIRENQGLNDASIANENSSPSHVLQDSEKVVQDSGDWDDSLNQRAVENKKGEGFDRDVDTEEDLDEPFTNKLRRDAYLAFRTLCKLSMKNTAQEGTSDAFLIRGKAVALELLKILLEDAGPIFRSSKRFLSAIKQYLCISLLKNSASSALNIFDLSCSILMSLVSKFRAGLKAEIGVFFPMIVLRVLENVSQPSYQLKVIVLHLLEKLCMDSQILVDIFVNYDCDVDSSNMFERMVNGLLKTAQGVPPGADSTLNAVQDAALKVSAIKCLVGVLKSMGDWMNRQLRLTDTSYFKNMDPEESTESGSAVFGTVLEGDDENGAESRPTDSGLEISAVATIEQRRAYKLEFQEGISLFNRKPRKGIDFLLNSKKLESSEDIAKFLLGTPGLDKTMIGDYLGEKDDLALRVMHAYVDSFNFIAMQFDEAIRTFLMGFRLPGEAQKIDRIMEKFAERYCKCNPKAFTSADTAYVLAYSVIMLNTDAHNPMVKDKMSKQDFIRNNRGIDDGNDLPEEFMGALYDRIVRNEIKMKANNPVSKGKQASSSNRLPGIENILNIVVGKPKKEEKSFETSEDISQHMQEQLKEKASKSESAYYSASEVEILKPMVEVSWAPMLAAFSVPLDKSEDGVVTYQCLEGFRHAIHVTAVMCMQTQRDAFVTSLAKFTCLHSPSDIKQKNIDAIKTVLIIAEDDGNYLQEAWEHVLTCISRFEHLHLIGEGAPPDATFFAVQQNELEKTRQGLRSPVFPSSWRKGTGRMQYSAAAAAVARRGSYDSAGEGGLGSGAVTTEQMNNLVSNLNMLEQVDSLEVNKIFSRSHRLNSEAIVDFVKALCRVSMEELRSNSDPRVFSLTKIVEISHFNMNRIRLVWSRMWNVLADFFVTVGCSDNLSVAMYVMDSLRQLAMKFLEREELANYNFQNQFMKPFVVVMQKSSSVEIRELIIRCVSQMVFARVSNVKSGWKIMFMVFTTAATDEHKNIVLLAFETIEKIVREYFTFITETETNTFTDCVNCLIAFTNSRFNQDISLNAIAFLRFCALKLAEGELGSSAHNKENTTKITISISASGRQGSLDIPSAADKDDYLHFWFPLLAGLSELTFDTRPDIRKSALEVLSDTLRYHGHIFPPDFWERIFDSILFPIFENVQRETESGAAMHPSFDVDEEDQVEVEKNNWLYETCTVTFQLLVDLLVKFYAVISSLLERFLLLMKSFVRKLHQRLASVGVAAFVRLISNAGYMFSEGSWHIVLSALKQVTTETLPDLGHIVGLLEKFPIRSTAGEHNTTRSFKLKVDEVTKRQKDVAVLLSFKIFEVNCHVAVQLLLVQAISEVYNLHGALLISESNTILLLDTLQLVARHAYHINLNYSMREKLQKLQPSMQFPDPPLLRLESESYNAYLLMLQQLPGDKPGLAQMGLVETRLVELCEEVLQVYLKTSALGPVSVAGRKDKLLQPLWVIPLASARRRELAARAPLVVATLRAVGGLEISSFQRYLVRFFPLLVNLVSCEHGSVEVQLALSNMFSSSIWPVLSQA